MSSSTLHAADRLVNSSDFVSAVERQEWERAETLWPTLDGVLPEPCWRAAVALHMQHERWDAAADALERLKQPDADQTLKLNLCRNLACLKKHRPEIYRTIADADVGDAYRIHPTRTGATTIATPRENKLVLLSGGDDPAGGAARVVDQLKPAFARGDALALLSIGDGYVLRAVTQASRPLLLGRRQAIYLVEPDPRLVFACMLIHDLTGPDGPIERDHVLWFVGSNWAERFRVAIMTDRFLPFPQLTVKLGVDPRPIEQSLQKTLAELVKQDAAAADEIGRYYASLPADHFARIFGERRERAPRVLLLTTRFSTVLQHSTRDAADALRQIGCEAQVMIEPTSHHALTRVAMRKSIAQFKPDLIFQIDHNRFEHGDLFPAQVPFVNWIQDLLPHLMTPVTGGKLGLRDFVLAPSLQRWVDEYAYPRRQCLEFRKLTRIPSRPISWASRSEQVVYVSNWSQTPQQIRDELTRSETGKTREVYDAACQRMIAHYMAGQSLPTAGDVRRLLVEVMRELEVAGDESLIRTTATRLFDRMNNLLFRQQGLRWARRACDLLDLELQIYGNGWANNDEFAGLDAGPIAYGEQLEELTRGAGVNLVLEPFVCISHQRLLDALAAGGFCLLRHNPANRTVASMMDLLATVDAAIDDRPGLAKAIEHARGPDLEQTLAASDAVDVSPGRIDHVALVRSLQRSGFLPASGELLPLVDQITFDSPDRLHDLLQRFTRDEPLRSEIARAQRHSVEARYSYPAGMRTVLAFLAERLRDEPPARMRDAA